jgi:hypothetical protein
MPDVSQLIRDWGYAGIFLVVIPGNIGVPVPEETVLAVAGYLVWSGRLQLVPVLILALVSAVAGDNLGYWLGRRYGRRALRPMAAKASTRGGGGVLRQPIWCSCGLHRAIRRRVPLSGWSVGRRSRSSLPRILSGEPPRAVLFVPYAVGIGYAGGVPFDVENREAIFRHSIDRRSRPTPS